MKPAHALVFVRASLLSVSILLAAGCTASAPDSESRETQSSDLTPANSTYYAFSRQDVRRCASPWCGGIFVKLVNDRLGRAPGKTRCADGTWQDDCYVGSVEYTSFRSESRAQADFAERFRSGTALIRGTISNVSMGPGSNSYGKLVATEAWAARTNAAPVGDVATLTIPDTVCVTPNCTRGTRDVVNTASRPSAVQAIEYASYFTAADKRAANAEGQRAGRGLLTAGTTTRVGRRTVHRISQFYTRADARFAAEGVACGSRGLLECAPDLFCAFGAASQCGATDAGGTCARRPEACTFEYNPVCGCDGETYGNACGAANAGVSVARDGECAPRPAQVGDACGGDITGRVGACDIGLFCDYTVEEICGFADALGRCKTKPEACTREYNPVCGCDGNAYSNACTANAAGTAALGAPNARGLCN